MKLVETLNSIKSVDRQWYAKAEDHLNSLAMPPGALGDIHQLAKQLCAIYKTLKPQIGQKVLVLSAADHGVMAQGVSKYPQITDAIVKTALNGGAAINSFCHEVQCDLKFVNVGLAVQLEHSALVNLSSGFGTADISLGPAMSREMCQKTIEKGIDYAGKLVGDYQILALGEMGLGNTSASTAVICGLTGWSVTEVVGPGTGLEGAELEHKECIVKRAIEVNMPDSGDVLDVLSKLGGFEIAFMTGLILGFTAAGKGVVLDGFITSASGLAAARLSPECCDYMFAGHQSAEPAHQRVLNELKLTPILQMKMRLGEGIGAALALKTLDTACSLLKNMMTLDEALKL
jgi:nicotinate-nucleotide--dimethylbenzimidazole phosphoribosyltransferase